MSPALLFKQVKQDLRGNLSLTVATACALAWGLLVRFTPCAFPYAINSEPCGLFGIWMFFALLAAPAVHAFLLRVRTARALASSERVRRKILDAQLGSGTPQSMKAMRGYCIFGAVCAAAAVLVPLPIPTGGGHSIVAIVTGILTGLAVAGALPLALAEYRSNGMRRCLGVLVISLWGALAAFLIVNLLCALTSLALIANALAAVLAACAGVFAARRCDAHAENAGAGYAGGGLPAAGAAETVAISQAKPDGRETLLDGMLLIAGLLIVLVPSLYPKLTVCAPLYLEAWEVLGLVSLYALASIVLFCLLVTIFGLLLDSNGAVAVVVAVTVLLAAAAAVLPVFLPNLYQVSFLLLCGCSLPLALVALAVQAQRAIHKEELRPQLISNRGQTIPVSSTQSWPAASTRPTAPGTQSWPAISPSVTAGGGSAAIDADDTRDSGPDATAQTASAEVPASGANGTKIEASPASQSLRMTPAGAMGLALCHTMKVFFAGGFVGAVAAFVMTDVWYLLAPEPVWLFGIVPTALVAAVAFLLFLTRVEYVTLLGIGPNSFNGILSTLPSDLVSRCDELAAACGLSKHEHAVLVLVAAGKNDAFIQETLTIPSTSVKANVANVYQKVGVSTRQELLGLLLGQFQFQSQEQGQWQGQTQYQGQPQWQGQDQWQTQGQGQQWQSQQWQEQDQPQWQTQGQGQQWQGRAQGQPQWQQWQDPDQFQGQSQWQDGAFWR